MSRVKQECAETTITIGSETSGTVVDREYLLRLLKKHCVRTEPVKSAKVALVDVIPGLRKAKVNISESFFRDLSSKLGVPFIDFSEIRKIYTNETRSKLVSVIPYSLISKYKAIPLSISDLYVEVALDNLFDHKVLMALGYLFGNRKIILHMASTRSVDWVIDNVFGRIHKEAAMLDLYDRSPDQSAYRTLLPNQKAYILGIFLAVVIGFILNSVVTFVALFAFVSILYFIVNPIKIYISLRGFKGSRPPTKITRGEMQWVFDEDLPTYTILVPVFREKEVLGQILGNLYRVNYPREKLDIKILMEEGDEETLCEAKKIGLFGSPEKYLDCVPKENYDSFLSLFDPIVVPSACITTKPRACNYGLLRASGDFCVIYDAEDEPDPDQLRKAAIVFLRSDERVVCLQSKLNFYNAEDNLLTKWFSIEYGNWFEFYLQGLDWINAPIPLGGTSNHFRRKSLDGLGRWDPYNVTEDADLGVRLARSKLKTEMIDSYTYEEATSTVSSWVRQRSRWYKGHLQTYLVHMRYPQKLLKDLGFGQFWKFQLTFGSGVFIPIVNPILWGITAAALMLPIGFGSLIPAFLAPVCIFNLVVGNFSYLLIYAVACVKLRKYRSIPLAVLMPAYWVLLSVASWRGFIQLLRKPFYWDKTEHGKRSNAKLNLS